MGDCRESSELSFLGRIRSAVSMPLGYVSRSLLEGAQKQRKVRRSGACGRRAFRFQAMAPAEHEKAGVEQNVENPVSS